jgi:hypothetical protein
VFLKDVSEQFAMLREVGRQTIAMFDVFGNSMNDYFV